jgi:hypothetical protein
VKPGRLEEKDGVAPKLSPRTVPADPVTTRCEFEEAAQPLPSTRSCRKWEMTNAEIDR